MKHEPVANHFHVIEVVSGRCVYDGGSLMFAAMNLEPGTVYGRGKTPPEARRQATERRWAAKARLSRVA